MGPKYDKCMLHPKMEGLLHLGPNPLKANPETALQRARSRVHLDRSESVSQHLGGGMKLEVLMLLCLQGLPH
jgi:hypothetical protein